MVNSPTPAHNAGDTAAGSSDSPNARQPPAGIHSIIGMPKNVNISSMLVHVLYNYIKDLSSRNMHVRYNTVEPS